MKRIQNTKLLKTYHNKDCIVCGSRSGVAGHHVISRGARGHDIEQNLMPLCFSHHAKVHSVGLTSFVKIHNLEYWMDENGWEFDEIRGKWFNLAVRYS
jgi:5-methylcytosine-specific restriction endonuclease McrA